MRYGKLLVMVLLSVRFLGVKAVEKVKELKPEVVLLDIEMPVMNGIQAAYEIPFPVSLSAVRTSRLRDPVTVRAAKLITRTRAQIS